MPTITSALFAGELNLSPAEWESMSVPGFGTTHIGEFLESSGWDGSAAACVGVRLSADNSATVSARLNLAGRWGAPATLQAQKLWPDAGPHITLELDFNDLGVFRFNDGDAASRYISEEGVRHKFSAMGTDGVIRELTGEERTVNGIGAFTIRAACGIAKCSNAKNGVWLTCVILVFPETEADLTAFSPASAHVAWPGIKATEGDIPVLPQAGKGRPILRGKEWRCPIAPALIPGAPWRETGADISTETVAAAVGQLLNQGLIAEGSLNSESLREKWEKAKRAPDKLQAKKPELAWPAYTQEAATAHKGECLTTICIIC